LAYLTQNKAILCKILIITLVFEKNANFFAENCQKLPKIVIITSTPDTLAGFEPDRFQKCKAPNVYSSPHKAKLVVSKSGSEASVSKYGNRYMRWGQCYTMFFDTGLPDGKVSYQKYQFGYIF
jgi:hypothetical protein